MNISEQMRVEIARSKIKKADAAKLLGMNNNHLGLVLSGARKPSLDLVIKFSVAFKCNIQIDYRDYIDNEVSNAD